MTFAQRLRELCANAGLSRCELARRAGIPDATVRKWWLSIHDPPFSGVLRLCLALRVELRAFEACEPK